MPGQQGPTIGYDNVPNEPAANQISTGAMLNATSAVSDGPHGVVGFLALLGLAYGISLLGTYYDRHKG
jgi:hypothetical protein